MIGDLPQSENKNGGTPQVGKEYFMTEKSRVAAGILGIFLGCLGIHKFYLGIPTAIVHLIV